MVTCRGVVEHSSTLKSGLGPRSLSDDWRDLLAAALAAYEQAINNLIVYE